MNTSLSHHLLTLVPADWQPTIDTLAASPRLSELDQLRQELDDLAERAAYLSEYLSQRIGLTGCGTRTHAQAVKAASKQQTRVSKALGYTHTSLRTFNL